MSEEVSMHYELTEEQQKTLAMLNELIKIMEEHVFPEAPVFPRMEPS